MIIYWDSQFTVSCLNRIQAPAQAQEGLVQDIEDLMAKFGEVKVHLVCREINQAADALSKFGSGVLQEKITQALNSGVASNPVHIWDLCPEWLRPFVQDLSSSFCRVIKPVKQ